jgi:hypothetical protein
VIELSEIVPEHIRNHFVCSYCGVHVDYFANPSKIGEALIGGVHVVACVSHVPQMLSDVEGAK